jgi:hypothetical protein
MSTTVFSVNALASLRDGWLTLRIEFMSKAGKENNTHLEHL